MKIRLILILLLFIQFSICNAQNVGIGTKTPDASAALEIQDTSRGILIPRMTMEQRNAIQNPAEGLMVYQTDSTKGFWYWDGSIWSTNYKSNYNTYSINGVPTFSEFVLPNDSLYYYGKALSSVSYLFINNHSDWRIPDQDEMTFIVQKFGETIFGSQQKSFWTRTVVSQTAQNVCNSISPSSYMPIVLTVNMMDLNNKPIGPIFLSVNPYPFNAYGCGAVNPAKANIILIR